MFSKPLTTIGRLIMSWLYINDKEVQNINQVLKTYSCSIETISSGLLLYSKDLVIDIFKSHGLEIPEHFLSELADPKTLLGTVSNTDHNYIVSKFNEIERNLRVIRTTLAYLEKIRD